MQPILAVLLMLCLAHPATAHPGKTDRHGGHKCYKECAEWNLYYREYHTHDKDGRPVKVAGRKTVQPAVAAVFPDAADAAPVANSAAEAPRHAAIASVLPPEPDASLLTWILLVLLLLLLVVRRRARNAQDPS